VKVTDRLYPVQETGAYTIIDEIPHMLPDDLREEREDVAFLRKWKEKIPQRTLAEGRPFKLS